AFSGFIAGRVVGLQEFGFGLAVAIFLDATIVRALLVPSLMALFGRYNWWLPGPIARVMRVPESDRKSTRLNSSHLGISYAVFCSRHPRSPPSFPTRRSSDLAFSGFIAGRVVGLQEFGFGLAVAIFLDATIVRALLVPSLMALFGRYNWWLPGPIARVMRVPE